MMTLQERVLAVYRGETPDVVPWFADLSHWHAANSGNEFLPFAGAELDPTMLDLHRKVGAGVYLYTGQPYDIEHEDNVQVSLEVEPTPKGDVSHWKMETPIGEIEEQRIFSQASYSWNIKKRMIESIADLKVLAYATERRRFVARFERYSEWASSCGDIGLPYANMPYSGFGFLISRGMGVEPTIYATVDAPDEVRRTVDVINENNLQCASLIAASPAPAVLLSDNFSADVQYPRLVQKWSAKYYREAFRRLHEGGKWAAVHIDGRLRGLLSAFAEIGADAADAVTPAPMGDLTPKECREEAGEDFILWGGIPPSVWSRTAPDEAFKKAIMDWLEIRRLSPRLVIAPGDQVPPDTDYYRIEMVAEMVEKYGRY